MTIKRLMRLNEVIDAVGLSKSTIYREVKAGNFPEPVSITASRAVAWRVEEIDAWIDALPRAEIVKDE